MQSFRRPESVLIVIYTVGGEFLLLERRRPPGFWQSVTGSLEWGETADDAARRELVEDRRHRTNPFQEGSDLLQLLPLEHTRCLRSPIHIFFIDVPAGEAKVFQLGQRHEVANQRRAGFGAFA